MICYIHDLDKTELGFDSDFLDWVQHVIKLTASIGGLAALRVSVWERMI